MRRNSRTLRAFSMPCGRLEKVERRSNFASFSAHFHDTIVNEESTKSQMKGDCTMRINVQAIRLAMADAGIGVNELAKLAGVSQGTAVRYATKGGNGSAPTFYKIGRALHVRPSTLVLPMD